MWKLVPLGYDAAVVAPITAITSEPVVIGRKTGGIADVEQFVNVLGKLGFCFAKLLAEAVRQLFELLHSWIS